MEKSPGLGEVAPDEVSFILHPHPPTYRLGTQPGDEIKVELRWDLAKRQCEILSSGRMRQTLPLNQPSTHGISYLNLRSKAQDTSGAVFVTSARWQKLD